MRDIVHTYVRKFRKERRERRKFLGVLLVLALAVAGGIMWQFKTTGIALTNETQCGMEEHTHTDECYAWVLTEDVSSEETAVESGNAAEESVEAADAEISEEALPAQVLLTEATETEDWYLSYGYEKVLVCEKEEHTHTVECLSDETANLETAEVWEATLPTLSGVRADDVAAIAESQVGYTESTANFTLAEDETTRRGYTRYGAWYGNAYGDWDAMFAAFCLHYAGISESDFPVNSGAYAWSVSLKEAGLYAMADSYTPAAGDLVFLDKDLDGTVDTVAVITGVNDGTLTVVEGNSNDAVKENTYEISGGVVAGYGVLPKQDAETLASAEKTYTATTEDGNVSVTVTAPYGALPEGAELQVTLFEEDSDEYAAAAEAIGYEPETAEVSASEDGIALASEDDMETETAATSGLAVLDICFMVNGKEVEPTEAVTVSIDASAIIPEEADASTIEVRHLTENENGEVEPVLVADVTEETVGTVIVDAEEATAVAEFEVDGFSTFTVTWTYGPGNNSTTSFAVTVYVDGKEVDEGTVDNQGLSSGESVNLTKLLGSDDYTFSYASVTYTAQNSSGTTTTENATAISYTDNHGNNYYTITINTDSITASNISSVSVYYVSNGPSVSLSAEESGTGYTLTATPSGFDDIATVTYTWSVSDPSTASIAANETSATLTWADSVSDGASVTVTVTASDGTNSVSDTYTVYYGVADVTFTLYYPNSNGSVTYNETTYSKVGSGVTVNVYDSNGNLVASGTTDSSGQVTLSLADGQTYTVVAEYTTDTSSKTYYYYYGSVAADASNGNSIYLNTRYYYYHIDLRVTGDFSITVSETVTGATDITVKKVWDDDNDEDSRPKSITVYLTDSSGQKVTDSSGNYLTATLTAESNWSYTWETVSLTDGTYSVGEENVNGYSMESATEFTVNTSDTSSETTSETYNGSITVTSISSLTITQNGTTHTVDMQDGDAVKDDNDNTNYEFQSVAGHGYTDADGKVHEPETVLIDTVYLKDGDIITVAVTYDYSYTDSSGTEYSGTKTATISTIVDGDKNYCSGTEGTDTYGYDFTITALQLLEENEVVSDDQVVTITNTPDSTTTNLTIIKMEAGNDTTYLAGAEFYLYYTVYDEATSTTTYYYYSLGSDDNVTWVTNREEATKITSVDTGSGITVSSLSLGSYYLEEVTAPDGYNLLSSAISFTLDEEGLTIYLTDDMSEYVSGDTDDEGGILYIFNSKGYELPSTGGPGTYLYTLAGLLLIFGAVCLMYKNLRRKGDLPY